MSASRADNDNKRPVNKLTSFGMVAGSSCVANRRRATSYSK